MTLHFSYRIGISTASKIFREVCLSIWSIMRPECIPKPTKEQWELTALEFERRANFPHCLGTVDGKHIRVIKPEHSGSMFYNYKDFISVVLMAVAYTNYRFVYADIGSYGKDCDSTIFKRSTLWTSIQRNMLDLPSKRPLSGTGGPDVAYFFVGDEGFAPNKNILRPFGGSNLSVNKRVYNYPLCRGRKYVECAFGILSNKWRIFQRPPNVIPNIEIVIVKASFVLQNFIHETDGFSLKTF